MNQTDSKYHQTQEQLQKEHDYIEASKADMKNFEVLYNKYHEPVFRFVYQRLDDKDTAFDITSQVFLKAMTNIKNFKYKEVPFSSWLYKIAYNELMDTFKKNKAQRAINIEDAHVSEIREEIGENSGEEYQDKLIDAITQLSEDDIQLIEMRFFEKRAFSEIGEILDITENNAKVKTYRVIDKLKELMY